MKTRTKICSGFALLVVLALLSSCGESDSGRRGPNIPPDTEIVTGPDQGETLPYRVIMVWKGTDPDGRVDAFEKAWHSGFISCSDFDTVLAWEHTTARSDTFDALADTCPETGLCKHTQTFCVRAIDNDGEPDPEPAYVSFTATTIAPATKFVYPPRGEGQVLITTSRCVTLGWEGTDVDGEVVEYRWTYKPRNQVPVDQPYPPHDKRWSDWSEDTQVTIELSDPGPDGPWSFYVQGKDNAGAVESVFSSARNHILVEIDQDEENAPWVEICCSRGTCTKPGSPLGCRNTNNPSQMDTPINVDVGDTLCFEGDCLPGDFASEVTYVAFLVNDDGIPGAWKDADFQSNRRYPPSGEIFVAREGITTVYFWARDDYCEFGSTNTAYIKVMAIR